MIGSSGLLGAAIFGLVLVSRVGNSFQLRRPQNVLAGVAPPRNIPDIASSSRLGTSAHCSPKLLQRTSDSEH